MSPDRLVVADVLVRFPRVSGDEPTFGGYTELTRQFSPREWG